MGLQLLFPILQVESRNTTEFSGIVSDQGGAKLEGCGCDEQVHGSKWSPVALKLGSNLPGLLGARIVKGQAFDGGEEALESL